MTDSHHKNRNSVPLSKYDSNNLKRVLSEVFNPGSYWGAREWIVSTFSKNHFHSQN